MLIPKPVVLIILDGWGINPNVRANAIAQAATPTLDNLYATCPNTQLDASEENVGLPTGQMGNSEVGHQNMGAGFVVYQELTRLDRAIADGSFFENPVLVGACELGGTGVDPGGLDVAALLALPAAQGRGQAESLSKSSAV